MGNVSSLTCCQFLYDNVKSLGLNTGYNIPIKLDVYMPTVVIEDIKDSLYHSICNIFDGFGGAEGLVKDKKVFIKINGIDFRKQCYTSPEVISAAIDVMKDAGANKIYVMENSTQGNITRLIFKVTGIDRIITERGAKAIYLDEQKPVEVSIGGSKIKFPKILYDNLIVNRKDNFYLSIPKFKTHSMAAVTLGVKCQMGFLYHRDRPTKHNFDLHQFLADIYAFIKPDFTIIDGINAIIHGHYPLERKLDQYLVPLNILIGGDDTVAVDTVGAKILGYDIDEVKHLKIASDAGLGCGDLSKIQIKGDISQYKTKYSCDIIGDFPEDVKIIEGKERACIEGCKNNTLMVLEMLYVDYGGHGPFNIVYGKGIDKKQLENLNDGPILVVGPCAVEEVGGYLSEKYPGRKIVMVNFHNALAAVTGALMKFMKIKSMDVVPMNPISTFLVFLNAKMHGTTAQTPPII